MDHKMVQMDLELMEVIHKMVLQMDKAHKMDQIVQADLDQMEIIHKMGRMEIIHKMVQVHQVEKQIMHKQNQHIV